jgi:hypothetical protein
VTLEGKLKMEPANTWRFMAVVAVSLGVVATAHKCADGGRVTCMKVEPLGAVTSSRGQGYGASGQPHCTPEGEKVYCLVDHNYHGCCEGARPCCQDGSNPFHRHHGNNNAPHDELTCSAEATTTSEVDVVATLSTEEAPIQVILDDMDSTGILESSNSYEGSYQPCMKDAYNGQFHHDWGRNKGTASFSFTFEAPKSGCYSIEEYHPGSDWSCSRYLPTNAALEVQHSQGQNQNYFVNQARNAAQWNEIGSHIFLSGTPGKLTMRSSSAEQCEDSHCFWVVDAFRLTWKGEECIAATQETSEVATGSTAAGMTPDISSTLVDTLDNLVRHEGVLKLRVHLPHTWTANVNTEITATLEKHQGIIESTLAAHFGLQSAKVVGVIMAGRRLAETKTVNIHFVGHSATYGMTADAGLAAALQNSLNAVITDFTIEGASVDWAAKATAPDNNEDSPISDILLVVSISMGILLCGVLLMLPLLLGKTGFRRNKTTTGKDFIQVEPQDVVIAKKITEEGCKDLADESLDMISVCSTQSPQSDMDICGVASFNTATSEESDSTSEEIKQAADLDVVISEV